MRPAGRCLIMAYLCTYPRETLAEVSGLSATHSDAKGIADLAPGVVQYTSITPII
jgi:hypothetical protein